MEILKQEARVCQDIKAGLSDAVRLERLVLGSRFLKSERMGLRELSRALAMSEHETQKLLRMVFGTAELTVLRRQMRIERSLSLMHLRLTYVEIARLSGYESFWKFLTDFYRIKKHTPWRWCYLNGIKRVRVHQAWSGRRAERKRHLHGVKNYAYRHSLGDADLKYMLASLDMFAQLPGREMNVKEFVAYLGIDEDRKAIRGFVEMLQHAHLVQISARSVTGIPRRVVFML